MINKLITFNEYLYLYPAFKECETMMKFNIEGGREKCDGLYGKIVSTNGGSFDMAGTSSAPIRFNNYDITKPCLGELCYNFTYLDNFFDQEAIKSQIKKPDGEKWTSCDGKVGAAMAQNDWRMNAGPKLTYLLDSRVKVLVYHGDLDMIVNWVGGEKALSEVEWSGQTQFAKTSWKNVGYGLRRQWQNVSFIKFSNAGHFVPMDQPENAWKMMNWFIERKVNYNDF